MSDTAKALRVGALLVVGFILLVVFWKAIDERMGGQKGYTIYALFPDAQGLIAKSRVTVAGIPVGVIDEIKLSHDQARVKLRIDGEVALYKDARILKKSASLLGEYLLAISPGDNNEPKLKNGDTIKYVESSPTITDVLADIRPVIRSVQSVAKQLERTFGTDEGQKQMAAALRNLSEALETANRMIQQNEETVGNSLDNIEAITSDAVPKLDAILSNIQSITGDISSSVDRNEGSIDQTLEEMGPTVASINQAAQELQSVLRNVNEITERTASGEGVLGRLTTDEDVADDLEDAVSGVGDIVGSISRLKTIMQLRSEYNFLTNSLKNYISLRIQPREDRYFLIELINDPRGRTTFETIQTRTSPPDVENPAFQEQVRVRTTNDLVFSLMLAKRIYFATMRFGILESSGGVGLDLNFFDDHLEFNVDAFQFGVSALPRMRVRASFEFINKLYLLGGVDDIMNDRTRDFFLGLQLRFNDEDLVGILPFAGGATAAH